MSNLLINIRAALLSSPKQLPNLALWLDAADASTLTLSSTNVTQWNDKSANALNVSQGNSSNQPGYVAGAQNGKGVVYFHSNKVLSRASVSSGLLASASECTLFVVQKYNTPAHNSTTFYFPGVTDGLLNFNWSWSDGNCFSDFANGSGGRKYGAAPGAFNNAYHILTYQRRSDGTMALRMDGTSFVSGSVTGSFGQARTATLSIGAQANSNYLDGYIGEIILYRAALSETDRMRVEKYLSNKWAV